MSQSAGIASSPTGAWVWLFPLAYGLHIAEEYAFHFPAYVANVSGRHISNSQFLFFNTVFWLLTVAAIVVVLARPSQAWLVITLAAVLGINAAVHLLGSIVTATYSPGTFTAALLYVPLVVYALRRVLPHVSRGLAMRAVALGAAIHAGVFLLAPTHRSSHRRERSNQAMQRTASKAAPIVSSVCHPRFGLRVTLYRARGR